MFVLLSCLFFNQIQYNTPCVRKETADNLILTNYNLYILLNQHYTPVPLCDIQGVHDWLVPSNENYFSLDVVANCHIVQMFTFNLLLAFLRNFWSRMFLTENIRTVIFQDSTNQSFSLNIWKKIETCMKVLAQFRRLCWFFFYLPCFNSKVNTFFSFAGQVHEPSCVCNIQIIIIIILVE